jgi:UDP-N-acetylglucosamine 2-epimerase (non-hydrolysing)
MSPKRILFLTHYFPPEGNAPANRVYEMARQWVEDGHYVTVITGAPNVPDGVVYPGYKNRIYQRENIDNINVIRVLTYIAPNKGMIRRILNYISFMLTAWSAGICVRKPDIVIATSPQFFCGWAGILVSKCRRRPFILEIRDIWPESIVAVGAMTNQRIIHFLEWLERWMYRLADHIVTVGEGYKEQLLAKGVDARKLTVIPNGINADEYIPRESTRDLRRRFGLNGEFICAYLGTIGMAAKLEVVLGAARQLKDNCIPSIKFMLIGDGAERERLQQQAAEEGLESVIFTGRQEKRLIPEFLAAVDACLVHLKKTDLFKSVLPSKIFEAAAMQKPIIMGVQGYAADLIRRSGAGICIEPENHGELCDAVLSLASNPDLARQYGQQGRSYILSHFDRKILSRQYEKLIVNLANAKTDSSAMVKGAYYAPTYKSNLSAKATHGDRMKILHVVGARPNFMKLAPVRAALSLRKGISQIVVHTGQHYDASMSDIFFQQLEIPQPEYNLDVGSASHTRQTAQIMMQLEPIILETRPDLALVYGDVNSTVAASFVCSKLLIPLGHVEAGLRSFDRTMPEETNRILTDQLADLLFTPSMDGNKNLMKEGISFEKIHMVGNVMIDTLVRLLPRANCNELLNELRLSRRQYALVTLHRPSNVDDSAELGNIFDTLKKIAASLDIIFPVHPRTRQMMGGMASKGISPKLHLIDPVGYLEFLALQQNSAFVITDSGGIQEETTYLGIPCITIRDSTERPITVSLGTNVLAGRNMKRLTDEVDKIIHGKAKTGAIPPMWDGKAGERIADYIENMQPSKSSDQQFSLKDYPLPAHGNLYGESAVRDF